MGTVWLQFACMVLVTLANGLFAASKIDRVSPSGPVLAPSHIGWKYGAKAPLRQHTVIAIDNQKKIWTPATVPGLCSQHPSPEHYLNDYS